MFIARLSAATLASVAVAALIAFAPPASVAAERTVKIAGWGAKSGPLRSLRRQLRGRAHGGGAVDQRCGWREAGRRHHGHDGVRLSRLRLQCRSGDLRRAQGRVAERGAGRHRSDLFRCGGGHVRHLPEDGGRRFGYRPPVPHPHRHRDSSRPRQEVPVDLSQRAQRDHHVRRAVQVAARTVPGRDHDLRGDGDRPGPLPADLRDRHRPHGQEARLRVGRRGHRRGHRRGQGGLRERAGGIEIVQLADGGHELLRCRPVPSRNRVPT